MVKSKEILDMQDITKAYISNMTALLHHLPSVLRLLVAAALNELKESLSIDLGNTD